MKLWENKFLIIIFVHHGIIANKWNSTPAHAKLSSTNPLLMMNHKAVNLRWTFHSLFLSGFHSTFNLVQWTDRQTDRLGRQNRVKKAQKTNQKKEHQKKHSKRRQWKYRQQHLSSVSIFWEHFARCCHRFFFFRTSYFIGIHVEAYVFPWNAAHTEGNAEEGEAHRNGGRKQQFKKNVPFVHITS